MTWKEIRSWAKGRGYICSKKDNHYTWYKESNPDIINASSSVSKLAKAIYNNLTDNKWLKHQQSYVRK
jgi:hypothetical protein